MKYIDMQAMTLTESVTLDGVNTKTYSAGTISSHFYEVSKWHNVRLLCTSYMDAICLILSDR